MDIWRPARLERRLQWQSMLVDMEREAVVKAFDHEPDEFVTALVVHPHDEDLALVGTSRGRSLLQDSRTDEIVASCRAKTTTQVNDLLFLSPRSTHEFHFVSSSALTARDSANQTLLVWDLRSTAVVADRINSGVCAFSSLRLHPDGTMFVAQSTADDGAILFSVSASSKRLKPKRSNHGAHQVAGHDVGCSYNADGSLFAVGDVRGRVALYCGKTQRHIRTITVHSHDSTCWQSHSTSRWASTLICADGRGRIHLFDAMPLDPV